MQTLLARLSALDAKLEVRDGTLHVSAPAGVLTPELQHAIKENKAALIETLQAAHAVEPHEPVPQVVPDPARRHEPFALTDVQHAYWVGRNSHIELGRVSSHVYFEFECGALDPGRLTAAFRKVIALHDMMRTVIDVNGQQRVLATVPDYDIAVVDVRNAAPDRRDAELLRIRGEMAQQVFTSQQWPLFDVRLIRIAGDRSRLCVSWDFLMVDAWSMVLILRQWRSCYDDAQYDVSPPRLSFRDYVMSQAERKEQPAYQRAKSYWWSRLEELPAAPVLPVAARIDRDRAYGFTRRTLRLPADRWADIKAHAATRGITPSSVLLGAFCEVLDRWAKTPHYCLNLTLFNRPPVHEEIGAIVGDFTNLMVLEVDGRDRRSYADRALRIQEQFLRDLEHSQVSAVEVLREVAKRRGSQHQAMLPVVFTSTLMLDPRRTDQSAGLEQFGRMVYGLSQTPQVWLDYQIFELNGDLVINWDAAEDVFLPGVLDDLFDSHRTLLESLAADRGVWNRSRLVQLPDAQRRTRDAANETAAELVDRCLHALFIDRALEHPDRTALVHGRREMTYGELLARSTAVAEQLRARGVGPNELVAVVMEKGWEQIVAVLGTLISGAAYLPIDVRWPALRRRQLLEQGEARIALVQPSLDGAAEWPAGVERIEVTDGGVPPPVVSQPPARQSPQDLAYVIFTSGSTGTPKGVMIDHRGAVNTILHVNRLFGVAEGDRVLAVSDLTFDLSVYDIFGLLAAGGTIVIPDATLARDPGHWEELIRRCGVTLWNSAPPLMRVLVDALEAKGARDLAALRLVLLSGDWIPVSLPDRVRRLARASQVMSLGGATEGSIWSIYYPIDRVSSEWDSIPYGKALPNQHMYVLNTSYEPCPDLVTGDIYIGGTGVALGYWKDPEKTRAQFVVHPETGERLYRTGDLGRVHGDGNIEFLGREDSQIKLRGHRVELGEIAACLRSHPDVREAVVQIVDDEGKKSLAAYVVAPERADSRLFGQSEVSPETLQCVSAGIDDAAMRQAGRADLEALRAFWTFWQAVERASLSTLVETLQALGIIGVADPAARVDELVRAGRILPRYRPLIDHWLRVLADSGHAIAEGGAYTIAAGWLARAESVEAQLAAMERSCGNDPRLRSFLEHVASCLRRQLALLSGEVTPLELLFPDGSWHLAEGLYAKNPIAQHHNAVVAEVVRALVQAGDGDSRLRVLELGAGTGGTSASVLPVLPAGRTEYWYTDLSTYFFSHVKEKFAAYPFVRFAALDIEKDAKAQGHQPHTYDLIIAANVMHNTSDIVPTLRRVRELLRPGGYLVLIEGTRSTFWLWPTFAYLDILRTYNDERAESGEPTLSARGWTRALTAGGFEALHVMPAPDAGEGSELLTLLGAMPQHVIAARAPAIVSRFKPEELAGFLRERLPDYMVPQRYLLLEKLPLTANGKIDLAALPSPVSPQQTDAQRLVLPQSAIEERILSIWRDVLHVPQVSVTDNFFEIGGDSLLITDVLRRLNQSQRPPLTIADLFSHPTIRSLAEHLSPTSKAQTRHSAGVTERSSARPLEADVAIIGMAGRFPDARNVEQFWQNLAAGRCAVRRFTATELLQAGVSPRELAHDRYVAAGCVLEGMDLFDASFFGFTPREAEIMDPQQRFLLECAVEALESAGYPSETHAGRIGVFAGKGINFYFLEHVLPHPDILSSFGLMPVMNLNEKDYVATLASYKLNLTGPSLNVHTACSTSLVAVHLACQSLLAGECDVALAGGVSFVTTLQKAGYRYQEGGIASSDGVCRAFSDEANGTVFGSGAGLVVLKPLASALRDRDTIHAVIKGSAINNDGSTKVGFSAPNLHGQAEVITAALARAGVSADTIQLLEAHGTGTNLGDPIEFGALRNVFGGPRADGSRCALGSVKTSVGHLDAAAGVTGLIKTVEALKHRQIPPILHVSAPNRKMNVADSPFYLNGELVEWPAGAVPRRAGVSSFGVGGTNAHVVVEEAPHAEPRPEAPGCFLLPVSAKSQGSLRRLMRDLADDLGSRPARSLEDVAFTLQVGRNAYPYRSYAVCERLADAQGAFADAGRLPMARPNGAAQTGHVAFLFPGQGAQQRDATRELYERYARYRRALDECAEIVRHHTGDDLREWLFTRPAKGAPLEVDLDQTAIAHPVLFSIEYALARLWESLGIRPAAMLGHSLGEYVAACVAGVFSLPEALSLMVVRGRLLQNLEHGRMLAVSCGEAQLRELLSASACSLAAVNGAAQCVVSGRVSEIDALHSRLRAAEIPTRVLRTSHAFHSSMVEPVLDAFEQCVAEVQRNRPALPFISNVTGTWITEAEATSPQYWARHMRATVRFGAGVQELVSGLGSGVLLEVGPGHVLSTLVNRTGGPARAVPTLGFGAAPRGEARGLLDAVGQLWLQGMDIDWMPLHEGRQPGRVPLPAYAFERKRYWIERAAGASGRSVPAAAETGGELDVVTHGERAVSLSNHDRPELKTAYVAPSNEIEQRLCEIWQRFLGIERIGVHDSFFELGGDSLLATRIHAQIRRDLDVELPLTKIFEFTTIRRIYLYIAVTRDPDTIDALSEEELNDFLPLLES